MGIPISALDRPIAYHRVFRKITGSTVAAIFLSQAWYWSQKIDADRDGWFYKTQADWEEETGLSRREQETARKVLRDAGILLEDRRGVPALLWFCIDQERVEGLIQDVSSACTDKNGGMRHTGMAESANQDCTIPPFIQTEITTETTTESGGGVGTTKPEPLDDPPQPPPMHFLPHPIFDDWQPDEALIREIEREGFVRADIAKQVPQYVDHHLSKGTVRADWRSGFRKWMRDAKEFGHIGPNARQPRGAPRNAKVNAQTDEQFWEGIEFVRDAQEARYRAASEDEDKDNATTHQPGTPARD